MSARMKLTSSRSSSDARGDFPGQEHGQHHEKRSQAAKQQVEGGAEPPCQRSQWRQPATPGRAKAGIQESQQRQGRRHDAQADLAFVRLAEIARADGEKRPMPSDPSRIERSKRSSCLPRARSLATGTRFVSAPARIAAQEDVGAPARIALGGVGGLTIDGRMQESHIIVFAQQQGPDRCHRSRMPAGCRWGCRRPMSAPSSLNCHSPL